MFAEFSRKRICECPKDAFGDPENINKGVVMKIDKQISEMTIEDYQKFEFEVSTVLKHNLRLLSVEEGCVKLTYRTLDFNETMNISENQKHLLNKLQVLSISFGEKTITICESFTTQGLSKIKEMSGIRNS